MAKACLERLPVIVKMGQRNHVPSHFELSGLRKMEPIPIQIHLLSGDRKVFTVDSYTLVSDVTALMASKQSLACGTPFALYESADDNSKCAGAICVRRYDLPTHVTVDILSACACSRASFGASRPSVGCAGVLGESHSRGGWQAKRHKRGTQRIGGGGGAGRPPALPLVFVQR
jgi:hypothetical protein